MSSLIRDTVSLCALMPVASGGGPGVLALYCSSPCTLVGSWKDSIWQIDKMNRMWKSDREQKKKHSTGTKTIHDDDCFCYFKQWFSTLIQGLRSSNPYGFEFSVLRRNVPMFSFSEGNLKIFYRKKAVSLRSHPATLRIDVHMCTLYTNTNTYMPRSSPSGIFRPSRCHIIKCWTPIEQRFPLNLQKQRKCWLENRESKNNWSVEVAILTSPHSYHKVLDANWKGDPCDWSTAG